MLVLGLSFSLLLGLCILSEMYWLFSFRDLTASFSQALWPEVRQSFLYNFLGYY
jgi:hypothetical protein